MNILSLENISKSYTGRMLFDDTSFFLHENEKVGLIGINGTGKSTLLRIIAGLEEEDEGKITRATNMVIGYLPQNPQFNPDDSVIKAVTGENGDISESDAKSMLTKLGVYDFEQKTGELSGGQRKRLALVRVLLSTCDILVLDEPTNHLDSDMTSYLEEKLKNFRGSIVMVTHDRYFLDCVCNRIVELDKGKLYSYDTNYEGFLELKTQRLEYMQASERKRQSILRKEIAWIQRGARARSTKQKAHIQRYENLRDQDAPTFDSNVEMSSVVSRLGRTTVELEGIRKAYGDNVLIDNFTYNFLKNDRIGFVGSNGCGKTTLMKMIVGKVAPDSGSIVIGQTVKLGYYSQEINFSDDGKNNGDNSYANQNSDRMGTNGIDNQRNLSQNYVNYTEIDKMDPDQRVIDYIRDVAEYVQTTDGTVSATVMLERFLFTSEQQYSRLGKLSGGEKRRLNLLRVLMSAPNVLILDEPTNDLDIATLQILEDYLDDFQGIVICVSHDRYFLDRVVRRIFAFEGNGVLTQYEGGYTDYESKRPDKNDIELCKPKGASGNKSAGSQNDVGNASESSNTPVSADTRGHEKKLKFSYKEAREFETIDDDIANLEAAIEQCDTDMAANSTNSVKLAELMTKQQELRVQLEEKMDRWMYLNELAEKIAEQG